MAIGPLQLPSSQAFTGDLNLGQSLAQLGQVYKQNQQDQMRQQALSQLGQGGQADAAALLKSGDMSLAQLGITLRNRQEDLARQATQDQRLASNDAFSHDVQLKQLALSQRAANRADEGPVETAAQRAKAASSYGIEAGTPEYKTYVLTGKLPDSIANGGQPEVGLNPAYGTTADGRVGAVQFSKTGKAVQTQLPEGFSLSKEPIRVDAGTHVNLVDPITRQVVGTLPKDVAGAEREKEKGSAQGVAEVALPQVLANSEQLIKVIDQVKNHPGKQYGLGMWSKVPTIPGTPQADFRAAADQLKGQTFLQAYQTLKGGGAITDIEGAKGENALARMQQAQSQQAYDQALDDFRGVVSSGMERAKAKARGGAAPAAQSAPADPLGIR